MKEKVLSLLKYAGITTIKLLLSPWLLLIFIGQWLVFVFNDSNIWEKNKNTQTKKGD